VARLHRTQKLKLSQRRQCLSSSTWRRRTLPMAFRIGSHPAEEPDARRSSGTCGAVLGSGPWFIRRRWFHLALRASASFAEVPTLFVSASDCPLSLCESGTFAVASKEARRGAIDQGRRRATVKGSGPQHVRASVLQI